MEDLLDRGGNQTYYANLSAMKLLPSSVEDREVGEAPARLVHGFSITIPQKREHVIGSDSRPAINRLINLVLLFF